MKQTLEQRLLAIAAYMDDEAYFIARNAPRPDQLKAKADELQAIAREVAGKVVITPAGSHDGKQYSRGTNSAHICAVFGDTDGEALIKLQALLDERTAPPQVKASEYTQLMPEDVFAELDRRKGG